MDGWDLRCRRAGTRRLRSLPLVRKRHWTGRDQSQRHAGHAQPCVRRHTGQRPVCVRARVRPLVCNRARLAFRQRDRARPCQRVSLCGYGQRTGSGAGAETASMKHTLLTLLALLLAPALLLADAGILIPRDKAQPDPAVLSLEEMEITIRIDNGDARVFVRQIFANHTAKIEEGNYIFALPSQATVSDFAVWDGPTRIPAVVLERKRAEDIYTQLKRQSIDPGLLQMGERGPEEAKRGSVFSARIVPIPPHGTKRLEIEYHQSIPVENLKSYFAIPLRPDAYASQVARHLRINFELHSDLATSNFQATAKVFPLKIDGNTPHSVKGHFEGDNVNLSEDFVVTCDLDAAGADTVDVLTYRNPVSGQPAPSETAPVRSTNESGFFEAEALTGYGKR